MNDRDRARFDALLEDILASLPPALTALLDRAPLIVDDAPTPQLLEEMGMDPRDDTLCGLHTGTPLTERSVTDVDGPESIHLFREGIVEQAGGWEPCVDETGAAAGGDRTVSHEIRVTLLHEIGHHFGLEEEDLERLGYG